MDCPLCCVSCAERPSLAAVRWFQCRRCDGSFLVAAAAFEDFLRLSAKAQKLALARARTGVAAPAPPLVRAQDLGAANRVRAKARASAA